MGRRMKTRLSARPLGNLIAAALLIAYPMACAGQSLEMIAPVFPCRAGAAAATALRGETKERFDKASQWALKVATSCEHYLRCGRRGHQAALGTDVHLPRRLRMKDRQRGVAGFSHPFLYNRVARFATAPMVFRITAELPFRNIRI
jgi:hypothetical protein